jgi:hypothetical protein
MICDIDIGNVRSAGIKTSKQDKWQQPAVDYGSFLTSRTRNLLLSPVRDATILRCIKQKVVPLKMC